MSRLVNFGVKKFLKGAPPPSGGGSPFVLTLLDTMSESLLTGYKFLWSAPKNGENAPVKFLNPKISKSGYMTP